MAKLSDNQIRGLITVALLVLLCVGLLIFCLLYLVESKEIVSDLGYVNSSTSEESHHEHDQSKADDKDEDNSKELSTTPLIDTGPKYRIRLNRGDNSSSGIVYIESDDKEGFVCTDGYDVNAATVTCRELGFQHGVPYNNRVKYYEYTRYTMDEPILSQINCTGSEQKLSECAGFRLDNETTCTWFTSVVCYNEDEPYELRLINGTHPDSGMVEMKVDGEWGLFCAIRNFDDEVADILCRNMNYTGGLTIPKGELGHVPNNAKLLVPYIFCDSGVEVKQTIFECEMTLNTDNVLLDYIEFRNNRYRYEYMACLGEKAHAAAVQCLK